MKRASFGFAIVLALAPSLTGCLADGPVYREPPEFCAEKLHLRWSRGLDNGSRDYLSGVECTTRDGYSPPLTSEYWTFECQTNVHGRAVAVREDYTASSCPPDPWWPPLNETWTSTDGNWSRRPGP